MFYELQVKSHVRVPPTAFQDDLKQSIKTSLNEQYDGYISQELGFVVTITEIMDIGEGLVVPGDGAIYYDTQFKLVSFIPELQEVIQGKISDITNFGAFLNIGPVDGMIHVSQTMDDYISFNAKDKVLSGKESKHTLKINDKCRARVIAVSYKDISNPKIGLTMRQQGMGNLQWFTTEESKKGGKKK